MTRAIEELGGAAFGLVVLALIFVPLERAFAARPRTGPRRDLFRDLTFYFWYYAVWAGLVAWLLTSLAVFLDPFLEPHRAPLTRLPIWARFVAAWFLGDLLLYWGHRLQHRVPLLWRFHRVHHTAEEVDWLASFREHPLDGLYTRAFANLPAIVMGLSLGSIAGLIALRGLWAMFIHANVRLSPGPLAYLLGAPRLHRWHHDMTSGGRCNYSNLMPLMDVIFGTYHDPGDAAPRFGVRSPVRRGYLAEIFTPMLDEAVVQQIAKQ
jgi:sterol desaturase/sphingolipid hydroxylase (fatty acid hydroxylase superfamily)